MDRENDTEELENQSSMRDIQRGPMVKERSGRLQARHSLNYPLATTQQNENHSMLSLEVYRYMILDWLNADNSIGRSRPTVIRISSPGLN